MYKIILLLFKLLILASIATSTAFAAKQERELLSPDVQTSMHSSVINPITPYLVFDSQEQANFWLDDMSNRLKNLVPDKKLALDDFLRKLYLTIIQYEAKRANLDPQLVLSIITVESKFNKYAISPSDARGFMQVMPCWQKLIGTKEHNLFNVQTNLRYGCTILSHYLQIEKGNLVRALARYNGSIGQPWYPKLVTDAYNKYWKLYPIVTIKNDKLTYINYTAN